MSAPRNTILIGDVIDRLQTLPTASIDCVITSPPYFQLRNYNGECRQIGLEQTVDEWVERMRCVMAEIARVLVPTGSAWVNLGDSYSRHPKYGAPSKGLLLAPERFLLAVAADNWVVRNKLIWAKTNPMPSSVEDRLTTTYDVVYFLVRQPKGYFFDLDAIRIAHSTTSLRSAKEVEIVERPEWAGPLAGSNSGLSRSRPGGIPGHLLGKNPGDVWRLPSSHFRGAHFATFPTKLIEPPLLATCPLRVCTACGAPWRHGPGRTFILGKRMTAGRDRFVRRYPDRWQVLRQPGPIAAICHCDAPGRPGMVLDPFFGTGTTGVVAQRNGRDWLGIELSPEYAELAWRRLDQDAPPAIPNAA